MKYTTKTRKIGDSLFALIPLDIREKLLLNREGKNWVEIDIKLFEGDIELVLFRCNDCNLTWEQEEDNRICPSCNSLNTRLDKDGKK